MFKSAFFQKYLLPGFVYQSIVIAGGYGTGRELVEYFMNYGPVGGLLGMVLVATTVWSVVCAVTFELARRTRTYEYRSFARELLGPFWPLYEVCYLVMMLIVLSVIAAAAGSIVEEVFGLSYAMGVIGMMLAVGFLVLKGTRVVEKFLSLWSLVLYAVYVAFLIACFRSFGSDIVAGFETGEAKPGWLWGGVQYAAYNVGILPAVLFSIRHLERRREALVAGALAGPIAMLPGLFFFVAMAGRYPAIVEQTVPSIYLLNVLGSTAFLLLFQVMLLGTLVETGTGLIHAFNERVAKTLEERKIEMKAALRPATALVLLSIAAGLAQFGLAGLIDKGYGAASIGFWLVFLLPVLTLGLWKLAKAPAE